MHRDPERADLTFLFTDVVASTDLAQRFPDLAGETLDLQHGLIVQTVEEHGGLVFERIGDAAYAAFEDATAALAAATEIQRRITEHDWGQVGHLQIRVSIDRGEVEKRGDRYFGTPLFRAARLQALSHAGEILVTSAAAEHDGLELPAEMRLRDLGVQRLRGLAEPVHVFGLVHTSRSTESSAAAEGQPMPEETERIRVLLVDDHQVVRRGLRGFLELLPDIEVVGEGEDGEQGVSLADRLLPDVVLMDLLMPRMDGLTAIATIKQAHPEIEIVAVTSFIEEEKVTAALEAGASGYLLKDADAEEVANAVRAAHAGEVSLDPAVARLLAQRMRTRKVEEPVEPLTQREKEVLAQLGKGASNKEIAYELSITERTARTHVSNILGKLGLASRTQAALYAVEHKLVSARRPSA
ncbi:MAG TPA: response regulator [Candidatus Limnocylindria bacterium]|nr:response regulator [Candidatus Limnocylindria bacterium]